MNEWRDEALNARWIRRHALFAPFGVFAATAALAYLTDPGQRDIPALVDSAGALVDLGAVLYSMAAVLIERGIKAMFWALEQREKWRNAFREEGREEGRKEGRKEGREEGRTEGYATAQKEFSARLQPLADERGVSVDELLRQLDDDRAKRNGA